MEALLHHKDVKPLLSDDHFSVDGTLIKCDRSRRPHPETAAIDGLSGSGNKKNAGVTRENTARTPVQMR